VAPSHPPPDPGHMATWDEVYRAHHDTVLRYLLRRTDPHTAQDLVAETFLAAWQRLDDIPTTVAGWLCGTARNLLANHERAGRRRTALSARLASQPVSWVPGPEETVTGDLAVVAALRRLSPVDQEILILAAWDQLPAAEAAQVLGCSRGAYDVRLHRARARLAKALDDAAPDPPARPTSISISPTLPRSRRATPVEAGRAVVDGGSIPTIGRARCEGVRDEPR
jgi:RNA polymerase sigma-70 factor, ECF subfamily